MNNSSFYHQSSDFVTLNLEVSRLKLDVTDIKSQNAELITLLSNISTTMLDMSKKYELKLKAKDNEITMLKGKIQQSANNDFIKDEISEMNDRENSIETENKPEQKQSNTTSGVENTVARWYSSCSSSTVSDNDISSQKSESSNNSLSRLNPNEETTQIDRKVINSPSIDEWNVISKKQKDRVNSKKIQKKEVVYPPGLEVANGWTHLHLYNVKLGTTEKTVLAYIKKLCATPDCTVVLLKTRAEYASFKIGIPVEYAETILAKENWSGNIRIKPWKMNAPPRQVLKNTSTNNSKADENSKTLITNQNPNLKTTVDNTSSKKHKTDEKEKITSTPNLSSQKNVKNIITLKTEANNSSTQNLSPKEIVENNSKTEVKHQTSTQNLKDVKSKTSKPKRKSVIMTYF